MLFKKIFFLLFFCFINTIFSFGLESSTRVLTPQGYVPVCELKVGDYVISQNVSGDFVNAKITYIFSKQMSNFVGFVCDDEVILLDEDQRLDFDQYAFQEAWQAPRGTWLKTRDDFVQVTFAGDLTSRAEGLTFYELKLEKEYTLFVTTKNIRTYANFQ